ncbi:hypothetical protein [Methanosarcina horonobensis]|nr:hypothetical protein [Methanosarcina horonobensis]
MDILFSSSQTITTYLHAPDTIIIIFAVSTAASRVIFGGWYETELSFRK